MDMYTYHMYISIQGPHADRGMSHTDPRGESTGFTEHIGVAMTWVAGIQVHQWVSFVHQRVSFAIEQVSVDSRHR